ncbi:MAG: sigma-54-dependent transcriptional regulator [Alcaligenes sp.]
MEVAFVDDDADLRAAVVQSLELAGLKVLVCASGQEALSRLPKDYPGVVVTDIRMPGMDGLALMRALHARDPEQPVVLITGHGDIDMAVQAMHDGAFDFLSKPYQAERLLTVIRHAAMQRSLVLQNRALREELDEDGQGPALLGNSEVMINLRATLRHLAQSDVDVLVEGETGTGKEVVAMLLHRWSARAQHRFVALNCGALPETIIESELFGHEPGAFTGAQRRRVGSVEHAHQGTLFLDEIESMPMIAQVRLLRVLETRCVTPLGSNEEHPVNIRVVAASKVDLADPAQRANFRADLYYRLNVVTLRLPPLRERKEDIPMLFAHFAALAAKKYGMPQKMPDARSLTYMQTHHWPGNVRELAHFAQREVLGVPHLDIKDLDVEDLSLPARIEQFESQQIRQALARHRGDIKATLQDLRIPRKTFYDKLQRHGILRSDFVEEGTQAD